MSAQHGCNDDRAVVENFKEALKQRVGADRYQMWFAHGIDFEFDSTATQASASELTVAEASGVARGIVMVRVRGQFALDRLRKNFLRELRGAAMQVCGSSTDVELCLDEPPAEQADLPLADPREHDQAKPSISTDHKVHSKDQDRPNKFAGKPKRGSRGSRRGKAKSISNLIADGAGAVRPTGNAAVRPTGNAAVRPTGNAAVRPTGNAAVRPTGNAAVRPTGNAAVRPNNKAASSSGSSSNPKQLDLLATAEPADSADLAADGVALPSSPSSSSPGASPGAMTVGNFVLGTSNQLAHTAMAMVSQNPRTASPLFLCGPSGTGKTHMLAAIADQLRRRHRMRRVMHLSAEQFTNDFISSVGNSGITGFRRRYREVDALLIDDVQFLGSKQATLRELLYTVETLANAGRPLVFSGLQSPTEIPGLSRELAGRMAAGLVCPIQPLDMATREVIFRRWIEDRCPLAVPDQMIEQINSILSGDGRVISGVVNLINTLQRMLGRVPTMDELRRFGGELLRAAKPVATLTVIEMAVCEAFQLSHHELRGGSQTRAVTQPRMLAMYLSRQLTSSAYTEIARHFGGKSHSTAISAENNVKSWLEQGKSIGRGHAAMSAQEAIDRVESLLRSG